MIALQKVVAAHPLVKTPYNAIKFSRVDQNGTPLYTIAKEKIERGALQTLRVAFERYGGHCFHCKQWMPPQKLSGDCNRDHFRSKKDGGQNYLHNLVFSCGPCNRAKGGDDVIGFRPEVGSEYLKALDAHLVRCLKNLANG